MQFELRGIGSVGRASRSQREGRGFESHMLHHTSENQSQNDM